MKNIKHSHLDQIADPFVKLDSIVKILRGSQGCPWDKKQTAVTLVKYLREETTELIEAIETGSNDCICEEIGDVFLILILLTNVYEEKALFTVQDALHSICAKMIRRHPHVFADEECHNEEELRQLWERIKSEEKRTKQELP